MKIEIEFAELHNPLFLAGTNLQLKLPQDQHKSRLKMQYDREHKELHVFYGGKMAIVPSSNVASMTPKTLVNQIEPGQTPVPMELDRKKLQVEQEKVVPQTQARGATTAKAQHLKSAQVQTPMSHVFADAPGKTRD